MSLRANVLASYIGQSWTAVMGIAFLPLYARVLGLEAYGLIGIYSVLQAWIGLVDLGIGGTISRETARAYANGYSDSIRELLRSLELLCVLLAFIVGAVAFSSASWLAHSWLHPVHLPPQEIVRAIQIMGVTLALRYLEQLYRGVLQGAQDLVWFNAAQIIIVTLRWGAAFLVLLARPRLPAFFAWQAIVACIAVAALAARAYHILPRATHRPVRPSWAAIAKVKMFAGGMFLVGVLSFLLMQSDKIIISKMLPLATLGRYTLAASAASGLLQLTAPISAAIYPKLTELVARGDRAALESTYLRACEWMAAIIVPPAFVLSVFAQPVMMLWTGSAAIASAVAPILSVLALGTLGNSLMNLPYYLQLAYGWTGLAVRVNIVAVAILVPAMWFTVPRLGAVGAAYAWLLLNAGYVLVTANLMYRRILTSARSRWYRNAVVIPLCAGAVIAVCAKMILPQGDTRAAALGVILAAGALLAGAMLTLPEVRADIRRNILAWSRA